ncbi:MULTISPECIES: hypothetical protein [Vibrio]|uniref:Cytochrome oxidase biogenesis cluster protein n=1 Tax=Vibrio cortegadensis TaxID=1328770 RepID=A0ABV4M2U5_9VIBR|nr:MULTISPECIES: hypothetical protein [Vibrio]MDN3697074.1 hypothetical protein [Vibrio cortegadensis]NOH82243.1 hypothetical protein [Vibrio sp. 03-59-1]
MSTKLRGRLMLIGLVFVFTLPAIMAKTVLDNHWYQSGVTNQGVLIEPATSLVSLGIDNPFESQAWHLGYVVPARCDLFCQRQIHLLTQSHTALGKYKERVVPVFYVRSDEDFDRVSALSDFQVVKVGQALDATAKAFDYMIVDPLGQLVMRYPKAESEEALASQSKGLLADLRKLLKLSRVG